MEIIPFWLVIPFFLIAFFYSMAGFGGGSSYLAILFLAGLPYVHIPKIALVCNLIVASSALFHYCRAGHMRFRKVLPYAALSVPMAYVGAHITLSREVFSFLLATSLALASLRLFIVDKCPSLEKHLSLKASWLIGIPVGGALGFLAGLVGIGGGIFLSPLLVLMRWAGLKEVSGAASFFIVVNSFAGLLGQLSKGMIDFGPVLWLGVAVLMGGQWGARMGSFYLQRSVLQRALATLVLMVSGQLFMMAL